MYLHMLSTPYTCEKTTPSIVSDRFDFRDRQYEEKHSSFFFQKRNFNVVQRVPLKRHSYDVVNRRRNLRKILKEKGRGGNC